MSKAFKTALYAATSFAIAITSFGNPGHAEQITLSDGSTVTHGDNLTLSHDGTVINSSKDSTIILGTNATISGNSFGATAAAVTASSGGIVQIGDGASITAERIQENSIAVLNFNTPGYGNGYVHIGDNSTIESKGIGKGSSAIAAGYVNSATGQVLYAGDIRIGDNATLIAGGNGSFTVWSRHADSQITIGAGSDIQAHGSGSAAVRSGYQFGSNTAAGGLISIGDGSTVSTVHANSLGLDSRYAGSSITLGDGSGVTTAGNTAHAVSAQLAGSVTLGANVDIKTSGRTAYAVYSANADSLVTVGSGSTILTEGQGSYGAYASSQGSIRVDDRVSVNTTEARSHGVYAYYRGTISVGDHISVSTIGDGAHGVYAAGLLSNSAEVETGTNLSVKTTGDGSHGVAAGRSALVTVDELAVIETTGTQSHGVAVLAQGGLINLKGGSVRVNSTLDSLAITTLATGSVSGTGLFEIEGDIRANAGGSIDLGFTEGSIFTGSSGVDGTSALTLDMTRSLWSVTGDSSLTNLRLDGSVVDLTAAPMGTTLSIDNLSGGSVGTFHLKTDIVAQTGDKVVAAQADGSHVLRISNNGTAAADGTETLVVVETGSGNATFGLENDVSVGAWTYGLRGNGAGDWELYSTGRSSPGASGAVNTFAGTYLLAYAENQTLMQRLGDLRATPDANGFWVRGHGGRMESGSRSFVSGFDMTYGGFHAGYDRQIDPGFEGVWKGQTYIGVFGGYSFGNLDYNVRGDGTGGNGDVDAKTGGLYASYVTDSGFYVDGVAKYMWVTNSFDVLDTGGERVLGEDLHTSGVGVSLEVGKRFRFGGDIFRSSDATVDEFDLKNRGGFFIEPQLQYSYTHQNGGEFNASNGLRIGVDGFDSHIGRAGVLVGYETQSLNVYAKGAYVREFDGDINVTANNVNVAESFSDGWWVYGIGVTCRLNDQNNIYMSVERSEGGKFKEPFSVQGGWRFTF